MQKEYVLRKLLPVEHVIWAADDKEADAKAHTMLNEGETLVSVKSKLQWEFDQANGKRF